MAAFNVVRRGFGVTLLLCGFGCIGWVVVWIIRAELQLIPSYDIELTYAPGVACVTIPLALLVMITGWRLVRVQ